MKRTLASLALAASGDVVSARLFAHRIAEGLGLDRQSQTRIATAVSEIARNAFAYARGARVDFVYDTTARTALFSAVVQDQGPGIAELEATLSGQRVFAPGRGAGLASARRLVDQFELESSSAGTIVCLSQRVPHLAAARMTAEALTAVAASLPRRRSDPEAVVLEQNREIIDSLTDLQERQAETARLNRELEETNRGVVALYSELDEKAEQLRSVSDMKSRFLSHMSHEFRTPLNSILALSRLLVDRIDGELNTEQERQVQYIRKSAQGLLDMVNDLLDLAKVEAGKVDVKPAEFRIEDLFASLRGAFRPLLTNPAVDLLFDDCAGLPVLYADEQKVVQVLRNFISNALKFTERGHVRVSAVHDAAQQSMVLRVEDTGIGIEPASLEMIFEEFSQVDGRLQQGGTGLGLPLSRRLATLMGGSIVARSRPGEGSVFQLTLPVRFGQVAQAPAARGDGARRVLVVDDEEAFRYVIRHIAQDAGYEVLEAGDGEVAMLLAQKHHPDLIFLDLNMPKLDGFGVMGELSVSGVQAPIIVCTSHLLTMDQKRSLAGAYAIVPKQDVSRDGLIALMETAAGDPRAAPGQGGIA